MPSKQAKTVSAKNVRAPARTPSARALPDALRNFDSLPNSAHVRQPVVEALFGCSSATVWRRVADGRLPRPRRVSERICAWNVEQLRQVLRAMKEAV
jgi:predicted DNA-binding transcriptional regulator AlpA